MQIFIFFPGTSDGCSDSDFAYAFRHGGWKFRCELVRHHWLTVADAACVCPRPRCVFGTATRLRPPATCICASGASRALCPGLLCRGGAVPQAQASSLEASSPSRRLIGLEAAEHIPRVTESVSYYDRQALLTSTSSSPCLLAGVLFPPKNAITSARRAIASRRPRSISSQV